MCKAKEIVKSFMKKDWSVSEKLLIISTFLSTGFALGFLISPIKKGMNFRWIILSHNGNHSGNDNKATNENKPGLKKKMDNKEKNSERKNTL